MIKRQKFRFGNIQIYKPFLISFNSTLEISSRTLASFADISDLLLKEKKDLENWPKIHIWELMTSGRSDIKMRYNEGPKIEIFELM